MSGTDMNTRPTTIAAGWYDYKQRLSPLQRRHIAMLEQVFYDGAYAFGVAILNGAEHQTLGEELLEHMARRMFPHLDWDAPK